MAGRDWGPLNFPLFESLLAGTEQSVDGGPLKMRTSPDELSRMFSSARHYLYVQVGCGERAPINVDRS